MSHDHYPCSPQQTPPQQYPYPPQQPWQPETWQAQQIKQPWQPQSGSAPRQPKSKNSKLLALTAILLTLTLILAGVGFYVFKDKIFDNPSYAKGTKPVWNLSLPNFSGKNYVEPVNDEKLLLVNVNNKKITATEIKLPEKAKRQYIKASKTDKQADNNTFAKLSKPLKNLPKCQLQSERPYRVDNGKLVCNDKKPNTVKLSSIAGLKKKEKDILPETATKIGTIDGTDILAANPPGNISTLIGVNRAGIAWSHSYFGPIQATVGRESIWVSTPREIVELAPASSGEYQKIAKEAPSILNLGAKEQAKLRAYNEYSKILNEPDKYQLPEQRPVKTVGYNYALAYIDKSTVPALLLENQTVSDVPGISEHYIEQSGVTLYLYQDSPRKLIKYTKPIGIGASSAGGFRGALQESPDKNGIWLLDWSSGTGEGRKTLVQAQDGKIKDIKTIDFIFDYGNDKDEAAIQFHPISERQVLIKALGIESLLVKYHQIPMDQETKADKAKGEPPAATSNQETKRNQEIAQAKKDGYRIFEGTIRILPLDELKKLYPDFIVCMGEGCGFPPSLKVAVLILPSKTMVTAHNSGSPGDSTGPAFFIYLGDEEYRKDSIIPLQRYNNQKVTAAVKDMYWASDAGPYGNQPIASEEKGKIKIIP